MNTIYNKTEIFIFILFPEEFKEFKLHCLKHACVSVRTVLVKYCISAPGRSRRTTRMRIKEKKNKQSVQNYLLLNKMQKCTRAVVKQ